MIKVAFLDSSFAGRFASGTAHTAVNLIDFLIHNESLRMKDSASVIHLRTHFDPIDIK